MLHATSPLSCVFSDQFNVFYMWDQQPFRVWNYLFWTSHTYIAFWDKMINCLFIAWENCATLYSKKNHLKPFGLSENHCHKPCFHFIEINSLFFDFSTVDSCYLVLFCYLSRSNQAEPILKGNLKTLQTTDWPQRIDTLQTAKFNS